MLKFPRVKRKDWLFAAVLLFASAAICFIPSPQILQPQSIRTLPAKVLSVDNSALTIHGLVYYGPQHLEVELLAGRDKGCVYRASNELRAQLELDKIFEPGDRITVAWQESFSPGNTMLTAKDHDRSWWTFALFGGFCLLLVIFGAWTGLKALFSFVFSCLVIFKVIIPLTMQGMHASWMIFGCVVLLTAVIIFLVAGLTRKALAAFAGAIAGILAGLMMAHLFSAVMNINGATMPYVQTLVFSGYEFLNMQDIFVGALILASSGAVMDLAMDIAAAVEEIARHNPGLGRVELTRSGLRIGRSVVGTMTTTLLLAYSGGFLTLLMMFTAQGTNIPDIINNPVVAAEIVKTLIGSFSLVLVAPFTAFCSGVIFGKNK